MSIVCSVGSLECHVVHSRANIFLYHFPLHCSPSRHSKHVLRLKHLARLESKYYFLYIFWVKWRAENKQSFCNKHWPFDKKNLQKKSEKLSKAMLTTLSITESYNKKKKKKTNIKPTRSPHIVQSFGRGHKHCKKF